MSPATQQLSDLGEFGLINRFANVISHESNVVCGIGDDCSAVALPDGTCQLLTTDTMVETVHFLRDRTLPEQLGYKALAVSLCDIAAMGGTPTSSYLNLSLPPTLDVDWVERFFQGYNAIASKHAPLLGGDTTRSPTHIIVSTTVLGTTTRSTLKLRKNAKPGDILCVTDALGDSGAGLNLLLQQREWEGAEGRLVERHLMPPIPIKEGQWLGRQLDVHAMIDLSDGLASDMQRITDQSGCGMEVFLDRLPLSDQLLSLSPKYSWDPVKLAVCGGEDYSLLLTVDPVGYPALSSAFEATFGGPLIEVGKVNNSGQITYFRGGTQVDPLCTGYDHFRKD